LGEGKDVSDDSRTDIERKTQHLEDCHDVLHEAYDACLDAVVEILCCLPEDIRREAIASACNDADWDHFAEFAVHGLTQGGTKQNEISIRTTDGPITVSLIPHTVTGGSA
jgi:hypothetical protein